MMPITLATDEAQDLDAERTRLFERAYAECWTPVFRFALAWTNDWTSAEDLAQEAFSRLWHLRSRIDLAREPLPWLLTATRHLATDRFRRLRRRLSLNPAREEAASSVDRAIWLDLQAAFGKLSTLEREALTLTAVSGYDSDEAATTLGTTGAAVRSAVFRARGKLEEA